MTCDFKVDLPYPVPKVECENKEFAAILLDDYAGEVSEHSAINLYIFENFIQANSCGWKDYGDLVLGIALIEMRHLSLLGRTITLLGVKPVFKTPANNCCCKQWTDDYVNYTVCLKKMLEEDIKGEIDAIRKYREHMCEIDDKYIKELLARIIRDEQQHLKCFEEFYRALKC